MIRLFPFIFILLWSSAFITTKPIIDNSDPFSALSFRFFIVALGFLIFSALNKKSVLVPKQYIIQWQKSTYQLGLTEALPTSMKKKKKNKPNWKMFKVIA